MFRAPRIANSLVPKFCRFYAAKGLKTGAEVRESMQVVNL